MTIGQILVAVGLGFGFGWTLDKAGLTKYHKIVNVYRFTDLSVLKYMLSAIVVGTVLIWGMKWLGWVELTGTVNTYILGNFVGGLLFGVGMSAAGFCPGTCVAGAGRGQVDYLIPGLLGFLTGGLLFGLTYRSFMPQLKEVLSFGSLPMDELFKVSAVLLVTVLVLMFLLILYVVERTNAHRIDKVNQAGTD
jgi:uncharacterized membrane protein YedE/YeeE